MINNISLGSIIGVIIFLELLVVIGGWKYKGTFVPLSKINLNQYLSNTHALGNILYTELHSPFPNIWNYPSCCYDWSNYSYIQ